MQRYRAVLTFDFVITPRSQFRPPFDIFTMYAQALAEAKSNALWVLKRRMLGHVFVLVDTSRCFLHAFSASPLSTR